MRRRPISLSLRFKRFRATMPLPSFGTIHPTRGSRVSLPGRPDGGGRTNTSSAGVLLRAPRRRTALISRVLRIRAARGSRSCSASTGRVNRRAWTRCARPATACRGGGGDSAWRALPWCSFAPEIHACSPACGFGACMSVSSRGYLRQCVRVPNQPSRVAGTQGIGVAIKRIRVDCRRSTAAAPGGPGTADIAPSPGV